MSKAGKCFSISIYIIPSSFWCRTSYDKFTVLLITFITISLHISHPWLMSWFSYFQKRSLMLHVDAEFWPNINDMIHLTFILPGCRAPWEDVLSFGNK